ncbi:hypothetical protein ILYODFUR_034164 [Ilyodon furcidens]|uniref:Uncharacterized protein n=1 Tax=Ilyodon furcidens TaxID=33524 RepID=A0ABV0TF96_9TELE
MNFTLVQAHDVLPYWKYPLSFPKYFLVLVSQSVIFYTASSIVGRGKAGVYLQQSMGRRMVHPGQVASPLQGNTEKTKHTLIHTPKGNLARAINLTGMSLNCGRKWEYPERTHAMQKD